MIKVTYFYLLVLVSSCVTNRETHLKVATSANMEFALREIVHQFSLENEVEVDLIIGSSGKLSAQIEQGAPFDLFVAANQDYPRALYEKGLVSEPVTYAKGQLILWNLSDSVITLSDLWSDRIVRIGIPNPEIAPYGEAAMQILKGQAGFDQLEKKLVYAESVSQANHFVASGAVDVSFTAYSVVFNANLQEGNYFVLVPFYSPILQDLCLIKETKNQDLAEKLSAYILSEKGKSVLEKHGYLSVK